MTDYVNEDEQWQAIKTWWKNNGLLFVIVVVLGLLASFGWRYWQQYALEKRQEASQLYDQLLSVNQVDPNSPLLAKIADELQKHYSHSPYASVSALFEAKVAVSKGNLAVAVEKLQWVVKKDSNDELRTIAQLRLARVLLAQQQSEQALHILNQIKVKGYAAEVEQIRGDIYLSQNKITLARQAYQAALLTIPASEPIHDYVNQQLNSLPAEAS